MHSTELGHAHDGDITFCVLMSTVAGDLSQSRIGVSSVKHFPVGQEVLKRIGVVCSDFLEQNAGKGRFSGESGRTESTDADSADCEEAERNQCDL